MSNFAVSHSKINVMASQQLIGRKKEIEKLNKYMSSDKAEFIAIYGRRRVGKTFLVTTAFPNMAFSMTGTIGGTKASQLEAFAEAMDIYAGTACRPANWHEAFRLLRRFLSTRLESTGPCIVFIDEFPCFDTHRSDFVEAFSLFWNNWASRQPSLKLIVCGSATSWMMVNLIDSHGGLHNRITHEIHLREFTLQECEFYLNSHNFHWDRHMIAQCYMVTGGVPYYLSLLDADLSLAQNIDELFFNPSGEMHREFARLYKTLFTNHEPYVAIVEALFERKSGMTRNEIASHLKVGANGLLTRQLRNLVDCDLVRFYPVKGRSVTSRGGLYQLTDFFTIFYMQFMRAEVNELSYWTKNMHTPRVSSWQGLAFERVCMAHIEQIKHALGLDTISTVFYSWRSAAVESDRAASKAQIDIVIERADRLVNICEVKYCDRPYQIDKEEYNKFANRMAMFKEQTRLRGGIIPTFVTPDGVMRNSYSELLGVREVTLDDLFSM